MAFTFSCPHCRATLRTAAAIPAGRKVQCPKCNLAFAVSPGGGSGTAPSAPAADPAPSPGRPRSVAEALSAMSPARRRQEQDYDDYTDEGAAAPTRRGGGGDFDFDDAAGEDEPRPKKPRKKKKKKKSGSPAFTLAMIGLSILLIGGAVAAAFFLLGGREADGELLAYIPANPTVVAGMNVKELREHAFLKEQFGKLQQIGFQDMGAAHLAGKSKGDFWNDMDRMVWALQEDPNAFGGMSFTFAGRANKRLILDDINTLPGGREMTIAGKECCSAQMGPMTVTMFLPSSRVGVGTTLQGAALEELVRKDSGSAGLSKDLLDLVNKIGGADIWAVVPMSAIRKGGNLNLPPGMNNDPNLAAVGKAFAPAKAVALWADFRSDSVQINVGLHCDNPGTASEVVSAAESAVAKVRDETNGKLPPVPIPLPGVADLAQQGLDSLSISSDGDLAVASVELRLDTLRTVIGGAQNFIPGGIGSPPPGIGGPPPGLGAGGQDDEGPGGANPRFRPGPPPGIPGRPPGIPMGPGNVNPFPGGRPGGAFPGGAFPGGPPPGMRRPGGVPGSPSQGPPA